MCVAVAIGDAGARRASRARRRRERVDADHGYVEGVIQSAFGNVTSQSYGAEVGFTVRPNLQVFGEVGRVRDVATAEYRRGGAEHRRLPVADADERRRSASSSR